MTSFAEQLRRNTGMSSAYRGSGIPGFSNRSKNRLATAARDAEKQSRDARQRVDTTLKNSATTRAGQSREAAAQRMAASVEERNLYAANLAKSQAETAAARDRAKAQLAPWREAGVDALGRIMAKIDAGPGDFEGDPGYQFRLDEGQKALERSASARGGLLSGKALKEATRYGQNYASNEYDKFLDRYYRSFEPLERLSASGMSSADRMGSIDVNAANSMADQGFRSAQGQASATRYGGEAGARGVETAASIIADEEKERAERHYGYAAFKGGENF